MKITLVFLLNGLFLPLAIVKSACDGIGNGDLVSLRHQLQNQIFELTRHVTALQKDHFNGIFLRDIIICT